MGRFGGLSWHLIVTAKVSLHASIIIICKLLPLPSISLSGLRQTHMSVSNRNNSSLSQININNQTSFAMVIGRLFHHDCCQAIFTWSLRSRCGRRRKMIKRSGAIKGGKLSICITSLPSVWSVLMHVLVIR